MRRNVGACAPLAARLTTRFRPAAAYANPLHPDPKVEEVAVANYVDRKYYDWRGKPDIEEYIQGVPEGEFTVQTYCEEALSDRHGCLQLVRWVRWEKRLLKCKPCHS